MLHLPRQVFQLLPNTCCTQLRRQQSLRFFIQTLLTSGRRRTDQRGCGPLVGVEPGGSWGVMLFQQEPQVLSMAKLSGAEWGGDMAQSQTPGKSSKVQVQGHPASTQLGDL